MRDVESLCEQARLGKLSKTTASRICEELRERFEQFKRRDLYDVQLAALFLDAVFLAVRPNGPREGVLVGWGFTEQGERVLLSVMLAMREAHEDWLALGRDLIARGLGAPLLVVADGAPGLIKAVEQCWPASDRQHCCVHRLRKLPERERERVRQAYWRALDDATDERDGKQRLEALVDELEAAGYSAAAYAALAPLGRTSVHGSNVAGESLRKMSALDHPADRLRQCLLKGRRCDPELLTARGVIGAAALGNEPRSLVAEGRSRPRQSLQPVHRPAAGPGEEARGRNGGESTPREPAERCVELLPSPPVAGEEVAPRPPSRLKDRGVSVGDVANVSDRPASRDRERHPVSEHHRERKSGLAEVGVVRSHHRARIGRYHRRALGLTAAGDQLRFALRSRVGGCPDTDWTVWSEHLGAW
jgi:hypothetical protein